MPLDNNDSSQGVNSELAKINQDKTQTFSNNAVTGSIDPKASNVTLGESNTAIIKSIDQTFHPSDIHSVEREKSDSMVSIDTDKTQNPLISNIQHQKRKSKSTIDHEVEPAKQKKINQKKIQIRRKLNIKFTLWILKENSENKKRQSTY